MATTEKSEKKSKVSKEIIDSKNAKAVAQITIVNKELKYIYPKGCIDTLARKAHRQKIRNAIKALESKIANSSGKDRKAFKEELESYKAVNLV